MKWWGLWLTLAGWWLWPATVAAQAASVDTYWQQIADLQDLVARLENEPTGVQQTQLAAAASQLALVRSVSLSNGRQIPISHNFLLNELSREPPDLKRLKQILAAWQTARVTWPAVQFDDLDETTLQAILSRPEFQYEMAEPNRLQTWLNELRLRLWRWLTDLFPEAGAVGGLAGLVNGLLTMLGVIALLLVLVYVLRGLLGDMAAEATLASEGHLGDELLTADAALRQAQQLSSNGDYRTAVRYLYLSALLLLEEQGLLRYNRSLTNREYLRTLADQPEVAAILRDVIEVFDSVWYGFHALEKREYEWYADRVEMLKHQRRPRA